MLRFLGGSGTPARCATGAGRGGPGAAPPAAASCSSALRASASRARWLLPCQSASLRPCSPVMLLSTLQIMCFLSRAYRSRQRPSMPRYTRASSSSRTSWNDTGLPSYDTATITSLKRTSSHVSRRGSCAGTRRGAAAVVLRRRCGVGAGVAGVGAASAKETPPPASHDPTRRCRATLRTRHFSQGA